MRKQVFSKNRAKNDDIKWRGHEVTRIEAFSDAVFAFGVTLLIMSLEVPKNFEELMKEMHFVFPFGICFAVMMTIWYQQNIFFRLYGLHDIKTVVLNAILMFLVLIYMYPLKFMIGRAFSSEFIVANDDEWIMLIRMYTGGFAAFYIIFSLMYRNALSQREKLNLTDREIFATRTHIGMHSLIAVPSILAVTLTYFKPTEKFAMASYILMGILLPVYTSRRQKKRNSLFEDEQKLSVVPAIDEHLEVIPNDHTN